MTELVGIWHVELEPGHPPLYVVYDLERRLSEHATLAAAEQWMQTRYWNELARQREAVDGAND